jgi:two-component system, cell cycle sensor histidine kinase and response regulator CckA
MSDARWRAIFDAEPDPVLIVASDGTLREINPAGLALLEAERPEAVIGTAVSTYVAPDRREAFRAFTERSCQGHKGSLELEMVGLKGTVRRLVWHVAPLRNEPEGQASLLAIAKDVTALREKEGDLRESRKMAAVGELAGGLAHDFNNFLNGIMGSLWMAATKLGPDHPAAPLIAAAGQTGRRAADLTRQLLSLGRRAREEARPVELHHIVEEVIGRLRRTLDPRIEVIVQADPDLWAVQASPGQVREALWNLCMNACDAMSEGGRLTVELHNIAAKTGAGRMEECVRLTISDTGAGIGPESLPHIFEPFFTSRPGGERLGLGLTVVQTIVHRLGGTIRVESEPGRGSRFIIEVPRCVEDQTVAEPSPWASMAVQGKGEVILVVDDEEILRTVARAALEQAGYAVLEARDGANAMEVYQRERARIAAVVTDMKMPGRSGLELLADLRKLDSNVRVVLCSGSLVKGSRVDIAQIGAKAFLPKPYSALDLARTVHQILDSP